MPGKIRRNLCHWNLRTAVLGARADKDCQAKAVLSEANRGTVESVKRTGVEKKDDIKYSQAINHVDTGPVSSPLSNEGGIVTQLIAG